MPLYSWTTPRDDFEVNAVSGPTHIFTNPVYFRNLDVPMLISWLSSRQYAPEGGFAGRTNKLVDGCYSHWVGGCWPLLEASLSGQQEAGQPQRGFAGTMYSRQGLIRYILSCCQGKHGGLRDKPSMYVPENFLRLLAANPVSKTCGYLPLMLRIGRA